MQTWKATCARRLWTVLCVLCVLSLPGLPALPGLPGPAADAQQPVHRLKGRVVNERGEQVANAEVRAEAFFGSAAGTFAGQRTFKTTTNAKGEWSIMGIAAGIWLFEVLAPGHLPEAVALPIRLLTASGPNSGGQVIIWDLVLKPTAAPAEERHGKILIDAAGAARAGQQADAEAMLTQIPEDADADYLAGAGRVALLARRMDLAQALFVRALERDPSSYRAALGLASVFLLRRDFDGASRAFDAARARTHDKDEQKFITYALGDLATIRVR